ncbi:HAD family hydrolase [Candidatus Woesearchaeota archaeon]|nr:HAD family hydrolase [Candidatus Woesearchaeota archaeon]
MELDNRAENAGLQKNKFGRWDSGELCKQWDLLEEYYQVLETHIKVLPVLKGNVIKTFERIKAKGGKIGLVSNSMARTIMGYVNKYGLRKYLDFVFSRDDAGCKKDKEEYWKSLIEKRHLKPAECLVIGDDPEHDVKTPSKLGFKTLLVSSSEDFDKIYLFS